MENLELLELLRSKIPSLETLIEVQTNIPIKGKIKIELEKCRNKQVAYRVLSEDLSHMLDPLSRQIFEKINLYFWGGTLNAETNRIWFSPKVSYNHVRGGSNGCDVIWNNLWFDIETETWIPSK